MQPGSAAAVLGLNAGTRSRRDLGWKPPSPVLREIGFRGNFLTAISLKIPRSASARLRRLDDDVLGQLGDVMLPFTAQL